MAKNKENIEKVEEQKPVEQKENNIVYFGVFYAQSGEILIGPPMKTQDECREFLQEKIDRGEKWKDFCKATTIIKRDLSTLTNPEFIFGCPKSLNLKETKKG